MPQCMLSASHRQEGISCAVDDFFNLRFLQAQKTQVQRHLVLPALRPVAHQSASIQNGSKVFGKACPDGHMKQAAHAPVRASSCCSTSCSTNYQLQAGKCVACHDSTVHYRKALQWPESTSCVSQNSTPVCGSFCQTRPSFFTLSIVALPNRSVMPAAKRHYEFLQYLSSHFASTSASLSNLIVHIAKGTRSFCNALVHALLVVW